MSKAMLVSNICQTTHLVHFRVKEELRVTNLKRTIPCLFMFGLRCRVNVNQASTSSNSLPMLEVEALETSEKQGWMSLRRKEARQGTEKKKRYFRFRFSTIKVPIEVEKNEKL